MASGLGKRPDPPSYGQVTKSRESEIGASDVTHPDIFTVEDSRHGSAFDVVIQDVKPAVVESLPFQSYEFEEVYPRRHPKPLNKPCNYANEACQSHVNLGKQKKIFSRFSPNGIVLEVKQHYIGTESDGPWFFPEKLHPLLCLLSCVGLFLYVNLKKESMQNFRAGKSSNAWIYYYLAQFILFLIFASPVGLIIAIIIIHV